MDFELLSKTLITFKLRLGDPFIALDRTHTISTLSVARVRFLLLLVVQNTEFNLNLASVYIGLDRSLFWLFVVFVQLGVNRCIERRAYVLVPIHTKRISSCIHIVLDFNLNDASGSAEKKQDSVQAYRRLRARCSVHRQTSHSFCFSLVSSSSTVNDHLVLSAFLNRYDVVFVGAVVKTIHDKNNNNEKRWRRNSNASDNLK